MKILIVSEQRKTLRHLSRFLGALSYRVWQATTTEEALAVLEASPPDFLIADSEPTTPSARELCRMAGRHSRHGPVYTLLMIQRPQAQEVMQAVEAGADDFLAKPIVYAELLVRLRTGARVLELERRLRQQSGTDRLTGLANREAFEDRLRGELARVRKNGIPPACVLVDVDFLGRVNHAHGVPAGDTVLCSVAGELERLCGPPRAVSCFGGGRFGVLVPESSAAEAAAWAEEVRAALSQWEIDLGGQTIRLTASFGAAGCEDGVPGAEELVRRASDALQSAKNSGRNCVVRFGQFDDESAAWTDLATPGRLFERTVARDVMTPCTLVLRARQTIEEATALLRQTGLSEVPVVDADGRLVGLLTAETVLDRPADSDASLARVAEVMSSEPARYEEDTPFATLVDFFSRDARSLVVIVRGGRPTGVVTTASLALLSEPLSTASFAPAGRYCAGSEYLLVADRAPADGG
ncbi:MAG TPA: diguanylate cyclase [Polyangia bacterium]|nr:diguanylate cyclase [Polyangia bacterium]